MLHILYYITESSVQDVDGDDVRCRWAIGNECSGVCQTFSAILNMVKQKLLLLLWTSRIVHESDLKPG